MTTPSNIDPDREAVARIFWTRDGECPTYPWTEYLNDADAVLALLRERGRLLPMAVTDAMANAACNFLYAPGWHLYSDAAEVDRRKGKARGMIEAALAEMAKGKA